MGNNVGKMITVLASNGYERDDILDFARTVTNSWNVDMEISYKAAMEKRVIEERIRQAFDELGIPNYLEGYEHVIKAVEYAYNNPKNLGDIRFLFFYSKAALYIGIFFDSEVKKDVRRMITYIRRYSRKESQKNIFGSYTSIWRMSGRTFFRELVYYFNKY